MWSKLSLVLLDLEYLVCEKEEISCEINALSLDCMVFFGSCAALLEACYHK